MTKRELKMIDERIRSLEEKYEKNPDASLLGQLYGLRWVTRVLV
jgi:hypothetical protein